MQTLAPPIAQLINSLPLSKTCSQSWRLLVRRSSVTLIVRVFSTVHFVTVSRALTVIVTVASKSVRDLVQWSLRSLRDPQALSSALASLGTLQPRALKTRRDLGLGLYYILDHSCNKYCDLIGQEEVSISHRHL